MCTTGICNAIYIFLICFSGWLATAFLILTRGRKINANRELINPTFIWIKKEFILPSLLLINSIFSIAFSVYSDTTKISNYKYNA